MLDGGSIAVEGTLRVGGKTYDTAIVDRSCSSDTPGRVTVRDSDSGSSYVVTHRRSLEQLAVAIVCALDLDDKADELARIVSEATSYA